MKNLILTTIIMLFLLCNMQSQEIKPERELNVITLSGSGYELGLQHGKILKTEIAEIIARWRENTQKTSGKEADLILEEFYAYADFIPAIKKYTPELYEEVRGIADGSEQSFNEILILNLIDEFWVYLDDLANHHCSGLGVSSRNGHPAYIAQNMDIENYTDGFQVLMHIQGGNQPDQLILTLPGLIALNGLNDVSIGVCVNSLMQLNSSTKGLPVAFVIRGLLALTSKDDVLSFVKNTKHASGQNYIIGIKDELFDFEAAAGKVVQFDPANDNGSLYHANHPLVNNDLKAWYAIFDPELKYINDTSFSNSHARQNTLKSNIAEKNEVSKDDIKGTLRSKGDILNPVCRTRSAGYGGFTFASVIMTLGDEPCIEVTAGPPDESKYAVYHFSKR